MARVSIGMELIDGDKLIKALQELALDVQNTVAQEAIDAGTKPVLAAMIANTPESDGSRRRQSAKTKQRWSGSKKLKTTIKAVVRRKMKYGTIAGAIGLVGPSYSDGGGHGNLFSRDHNKKVLWGKDSGAIRKVNQFVKKTADETKSAASAAVTSALKAGIEAAANRMAK
jgi:hypothetical protein